MRPFNHAGGGERIFTHDHLCPPWRGDPFQHAALLKALKPGDKIVTNSGIVGVVVGLRDHYVTIRSEDTKLELLKSAIQEVTERKP